MRRRHHRSRKWWGQLPHSPLHRHMSRNPGMVHSFCNLFSGLPHCIPSMSIITAVKSPPKNPCSRPDQMVIGMMRIWLKDLRLRRVAISSFHPLSFSLSSRAMLNLFPGRKWGEKELCLWKFAWAALCFLLFRPSPLFSLQRDWCSEMRKRRRNEEEEEEEAADWKAIFLVFVALQILAPSLPPSAGCGGLRRPPFSHAPNLMGRERGNFRSPSQARLGAGAGRENLSRESVDGLSFVTRGSGAITQHWRLVTMRGGKRRREGTLVAR